MAIAAGVDSIEHGSFLEPETLSLMKRKGHLPGADAARRRDGGARSSRASRRPIAAKAKAAIAARTEMFRNAAAPGVKIAFGTDSAVSRTARTPEEFALMTGLGMSPAAALRTATSAAADLLGVADSLGTLAAGQDRRHHRRAAATRSPTSTSWRSRCW